MRGGEFRGWGTELTPSRNGTSRANNGTAQLPPPNLASTSGNLFPTVCKEFSWKRKASGLEALSYSGGRKARTSLKAGHYKEEARKGARLPPAAGRQKAAATSPGENRSRDGHLKAAATSPRENRSRDGHLKAAATSPRENRSQDGHLKVAA